MRFTSTCTCILCKMTLRERSWSTLTTTSRYPEMSSCPKEPTIASLYVRPAASASRPTSSHVDCFTLHSRPRSMERYVSLHSRPRLTNRNVSLHLRSFDEMKCPNVFATAFHETRSLIAFATEFDGTKRLNVLVTASHWTKHLGAFATAFDETKCLIALEIV